MDTSDDYFMHQCLRDDIHGAWMETQSLFRGGQTSVGKHGCFGLLEERDRAWVLVDTGSSDEPKVQSPARESENPLPNAATFSVARRRGLQVGPRRGVILLFVASNITSIHSHILQPFLFLPSQLFKYRVSCSWFHTRPETFNKHNHHQTLHASAGAAAFSTVARSSFSARLSDRPLTRFLVPFQENLSYSFTAISHTTTQLCTAKMGKGLRSSVNKTNNRKLKKNVFGPVETARTERLSQKLLELASQPKPPKSDMEVEESSGENSLRRQTHVPKLTIPFADSKQAESEAKATDANGALNALAIPVPKSLAHQCPTTAAASTNMLTPPPTPPLDISDFSNPSVRSAHRRYADEQLFFHLLGVSTDVHGFDSFGNICLGFGSDSESDNESSSSSGSSSLGSGYE